MNRNFFLAILNFGFFQQWSVLSAVQTRTKRLVVRSHWQRFFFFFFYFLSLSLCAFQLPSSIESFQTLEMDGRGKTSKLETTQIYLYNLKTFNMGRTSLICQLFLSVRNYKMKCNIIHCTIFSSFCSTRKQPAVRDMIAIKS